MNTEQANLVSIIIPTYNGEEFVKESVESVLNQTFTNFELIFCDDASRDRTPEIVETYKQTDPRISLFTFSDNAGLAGNWNRGLKKARGVYLKILCQDDILAPTYLEETVGIMEKHDTVSLVCSFEKTIGEVSKTRSFNDLPGWGELEGRRSQELIIKQGNWIGAPSATLFRSKDLSRTGLFDSRLPCSLDWEMWLRFLGVGNLYVIPEILYSTRIHPGQETSNCVRKLGFFKDRVAILHKIRQQPDLYGRENWQISKKVYKQSVDQLVYAARNKGNAQVKDTVRFLNQFQSPLVTWTIVLKTGVKRFLKSLKQFVTGRRR